MKNNKVLNLIEQIGKEVRKGNGAILICYTDNQFPETGVTAVALGTHTPLVRAISETCNRDNYFDKVINDSFFKVMATKIFEEITKDELKS